MSLSDRQARHLQGVHGPTILVPAGANEFDYAVEMPPWMEIGRTSRGLHHGRPDVVKEGGAERYVSYSSVAQNDQIIAVMETGRLERRDGKVNDGSGAGQERCGFGEGGPRKGLAGPVKLELVLPARRAAFRPGRSSWPRTSRSRASHVHFAADAMGPLDMPITLRAVLMDKGDPVIAETKLEVLSEN